MANKLDSLLILPLYVPDIHSVCARHLFGIVCGITY